MQRQIAGAFELDEQLSALEAHDDTLAVAPVAHGLLQPFEVAGKLYQGYTTQSLLTGEGLQLLDRHKMRISMADSSQEPKLLLRVGDDDQVGWSHIFKEQRPFRH